MVAPGRTWFWAMGALALLASTALAQQAELPRFTGNGSVTQAIDGEQGAVLDIGSGITMTFPKGLPVGRSRLVTLKKAAKKPTGAQVQKGFTPIATPVDFSTPLNTAKEPIVLAMAQKADPRKKAERLVLAVEISTLCNDQNKATKGKNGLCSGWELVDAEFEGSALVAKLTSTGGGRLVFGLMAPEKMAPEK